MKYVFENHGMDSRYTGPLDVCPTIYAHYGTGGGNVPIVVEVIAVEPKMCNVGFDSAYAMLDSQDKAPPVVVVRKDLEDA